MRFGEGLREWARCREWRGGNGEFDGNRRQTGAGHATGSLRPVRAGRSGPIHVDSYPRIGIAGGPDVWSSG